MKNEITRKEVVEIAKRMNIKNIKNKNIETLKKEIEEMKNKKFEESKKELENLIKEEEKKEEVKEIKEEKKAEEKKEEKKEKEDNFNKCVKNISAINETIFSRMKDNSVAVKHETTNQKTRKKVVLYRVYASNKNKFRIDTTIEDIFKDTNYETRQKSASVYFVIKNLTAEELQTVTKKLNENAKRYIFK